MKKTKPKVEQKRKFKTRNQLLDLPKDYWANVPGAFPKIVFEILDRLDDFRIYKYANVSLGIGNPNWNDHGKKSFTRITVTISYNTVNQTRSFTVYDPDLMYHVCKKFGLDKKMIPLRSVKRKAN